MSGTRERILDTALKLFAVRGYEGVSVRDIAGELGMTQAALYKHYSNKRDIFASILKQMEREDARRAAECSVPQESFADNASAYDKTAAESLAAFTLNMFEYWTEDAFAAAFRRMMTVEQYRDEDMKRLYSQYFSGGVIDYTADLLCSIKEFKIDKARAKLEAAKFFGPVYMLMNLYDEADNKAEVKSVAAQHIKEHIAKLKGEQ